MNNIFDNQIVIVFTIAALLIITLVIYLVVLSGKINKLEHKIDELTAESHKE